MNVVFKKQSFRVNLGTPIARGGLESMYDVVIEAKRNAEEFISYSLVKGDYNTVYGKISNLTPVSCLIKVAVQDDDLKAVMVRPAALILNGNSLVILIDEVDNTQLFWTSSGLTDEDPTES